MKIKSDNNVKDSRRSGIRSLEQHSSNPFVVSEGAAYVNVGVDTVEVLSSLRMGSYHLFLCVAKAVSEGSDMVKVDYSMFRDFTGVRNLTSYYEAVTELADKKIIALVRLPYFFVNPAFLKKS